MENVRQILPGLINRLPAGIRQLVPAQVGNVPLRPQGEQERQLSVQERLPMASVEDGVVFLKAEGAPSAVKVVEVLPINFRLKSPFERRQILRSFTEALNALKYPVQLRNHAEPLDLTGYIEGLEALAGRERSPFRKQALVQYADYIGALTHDKELVRRRFYLVLPYVGHVSNPTAGEIRKTLHQHALDMSERLHRCGLATMDLNDSELTNLYHALLRPDFLVEQRIIPQDLRADTFLNLVAPETLEFHADHFQMGDKLSRVLMVTGYREVVEEGWLSDLYSYSPQVAIIQHIEPTRADILQKDISNSLGEIAHQLAKGGMSPLEVKQAELKAKSGDYLLGQLASGSQQVLDFSMYVQITADSVTELNDLTRKMEGMLGGKAMKTRRTRHRTQQAFDTALPVCVNALRDSAAWQMPAETVASTFPFDHAELSHTWGILRGVNKFTKNAVIIDPYHPTLTNPHEVSIATTGGGKSIEMKATIDRSHSLWDRVFALDIEREYRQLCKARGGQWINLAPGAGNIINPMEIRPPAFLARDDDDAQETAGQPAREDTNPLLAAIQRQQALFGLMLPGLTEEEISWTEEAQFATYRAAGIDERTDVTRVPRDAWPHLGHLVAQLAEREQTLRLAVVLQRWTEGSLRGIINGQTTVDLNASFVVLDIHDLEGMQRAQPPILYAALTYLWDEIRRDRTQRKTLAVDEMGLLKENQQALWFLWMLSKRARKYGCRLKTATQQVADFLSAGYYAEAIIGNAETKVLGRQKETDLKALKALVPFSEEEQALLAGMAPEDKLLMVGSQRVLVEVTVSDEELMVYDQPAYMRRRGGGGQG